MSADEDQVVSIVRRADVLSWLLEGSSDGITISRLRDGRFIQVNETFLRMTGYERDEVIGRSSLDLGLWHGPEDRTVLVEALGDLGSVGQVEYPVRTKSGEMRRVEGSVQLIDVEGEHLLLTIIRDVTERNRLQEELRSSQQQVIDILQSMPAAFFAVDRDFNLTFINDLCEMIMGRPRSEMLGKNLWEEFAPVLDTPFYAAGIKAMTERAVVEVEDYYPPFDSWFEVHAYPVGDDLSVYFRDVTSRRRAEEALREAEVRYRTLVEQIPALTYVDAVEGPNTTLYISPQTEALFGFSQEEWLSNPDLLKEQVHPDDRERWLAENERGDVTGEPFKLEYRILAKDGRVVWVQDAAVLVRNDSGEPRFWQGAMFDITERKEAEAERQTLVSRLIHAAEEERIRVSAELHDGPIQHLAALDYEMERLLLRLQADDLSDADEAVMQIQTGIRDEIQGLRRIMADLRPPILEDKGLAAALRHHAETLKAETDLRITVAASFDEPLDATIEMVLYRVAQEALTNVVKHAQAGRSTVSLRSGGDGWVELEIRDDGVGFDPRAAEAGPRGEHFGLAAMRERVQMAGGTYEVVSGPREGTVIRVVLPAARR